MIWPLLRNEISKALRRKLPYLGVLAVGGLCVLFRLAMQTMNEQHTLSSWGYLSTAIQLTMANVGLVFVAIFSAALVAEERGSGTLRVVLSCPVSRTEFLVSKALTALLYMLVLAGTALLVSVALAWTKFTFGDVVDESGIVYSRRSVAGNFLLCVLLDFCPLTAAVFYGLLISVLTRNAGQAIGAAIGIGVLVMTATPILGVKDYVFHTYAGASWTVFEQIARGLDYTWQPDIWRMILVPLTYSIVFFVASLLILRGRNLNG